MARAFPRKPATKDTGHLAEVTLLTAKDFAHYKGTWHVSEGEKNGSMRGRQIRERNHRLERKSKIRYLKACGEPQVHSHTQRVPLNPTRKTSEHRGRST